MLKIFAYLLLFFLPVFSFAQKTWDGGAGTSNWGDATNWNPDGVPAAGDDVTIDPTADLLPLVVNGNYSCNNLGITSSKHVTVQTTAVGNTLTINGTLTINASINKNNILDAAAGTINVIGGVTFGPATGSERDAITVSTGTITFSSLVTMLNSSLCDITFTGAGTINFNGGFTDNAGVFTTFDGCTVNFGGSYTNNFPGMTWNPNSLANFTCVGCSFTANANITFGNVSFADASAVTHANAGGWVKMQDVTFNNAASLTVLRDFEVNGNWINNSGGGALIAAANRIIYFKGVSKNIGGTSSTSFPDISIGNGAANIAHTMNNSNSCNDLIFASDGQNSTLSLGSSSVTLTVTGNLTINQPTTASMTHLLNVNAGTCSVAGSLNFTGTSVDGTRVAKISVTSGSFSLTNGVTWMAQPAGTGVVSTEVITVSTGTVAFGSSLSMPDGSGTLNITGSGTVNFYGAAAPSFNFFNGANAADVNPVFTTSSGCILNFFNGFTNSNVALSLANGSTSIFTGSGIITPNADITFGNVQINAAPTVTLAIGGIFVTGNWTNNGGTFNPSTFSVTFNGTSSQTITKAGGETFYTLTANTTGPLILANDVIVTNTLNMNGGNFNLNSKILTLGNSTDATLTRTAGIMYEGTFKRWWPSGLPVSSTAAPLRGLFPVGSSSNYSPVEINSTSDPTTTGYVAAQHQFALNVNDLSPYYTDNESDVIERIHDTKSILTATGFGGDLGQYNIDVTFTILSSLGFLTDMKLETYTGAVMGSVGASAVTTGTIPAPTVKRMGLTVAQLSNVWVLATKNKAATPLRTVYYSRVSGDWADVVSVWSSSDGGPACGCSPAAISDGYAIIVGGTTVSVASNSSVDFVDIRNGGILNGTANLTVNYDLTTLGGTGAFSPSTGAWIVSRNVKLNGISNSNTPGGSAMTITGNLFLTSGTTLALGANLNVAGNLTIDGSLALGGFNLALNGSGKTITGSSGSITTSGGTPSITLTNNKTISSGTTLTFGTTAIPVTLALETATSVTSNGSVSLNGNMTGNDASSEWINDAGGTLNITGVLLNTGTLNASTNGNTINYNGLGAQTIKKPASSYYNLTCSNAGTKSISIDAVADVITVTNGTVTIQDAAIFDEGENINDLSGNAALSMTDISQLIVRNGNISTTLPELTGGYTLSAGTITITAATAGGTTVTVRVATYNNLILNGGINHNLSSVSSISNDLTISGTVDIISNGVLTVGGILNYSSTDADGWTLTNNITAGQLTLSGGTITDGGRVININGTGWSKNGGTFSTTGSVRFTGTMAQTIGGTQATTFKDLIIDNSSLTGVSLTQACSTSATGVLTLSDGELILNSNTLTVINSASSAVIGGGAPSYIKSEGENSILKWNIGTTLGDYYFPFGNNGVYLPFRLNKTTTGTGAGNYSVSIWFTAANTTPPTGVSVCPDENNTSDRFWQINLAGYTVNPTADIYFSYDESELDGIAEADLQMQRWDAAMGGACKWVTPTIGTVDVINNYVAVSGVSQFSPWGMSKRSAPLPIELLYFDAELNKGIVDLTWTTATEINNDYFTVERSSGPALSTGDGAWVSVVTVKGAGNSNVLKEYSEMDENPPKGISYYRLKQTDFDGRFTYSDLVAINISEDKNTGLIIFPNPSDGKNVHIGFNGNEKNLAVLVVLNDMEGKQVYSKVILTDDNGSFVFAVDTENRLPAGIYLVVGSSRNNIYSRKLVIK